MSPRRSDLEAAGTRRAILDRAVAEASVEGLEGLSFGRVASGVGMSKAGVLRHFPSKEELQLAALDAAAEIFRQRVWQPAAGVAPGRARLAAVCDAWVAYLSDPPFPGGCFFAAAACEWDGRDGVVRDAVQRQLARNRRALEAEARTAVEAGELPAGTDPMIVAFRIEAYALAVNQGIQLWHDPAAADRGRVSMRAALN